MNVRLMSAALCFALLPASAMAYDDAAIKAQCDAEWGTDFAMVKYCRDQQRAAGEAYDRFKQLAAGNETAAIILAQCEGEWAKDYSMVMYCTDQQTSALRALGTTPQDVPANISETIRAQCSAEWGADFSMVAYCVDQQTTSWRSLQ